MVNQDLQNYVQGELSKGVPLESIKNQVLQAGWQATLVDEVFSAIQTSPNKASLLQPSIAGASITEKNYPITTLWVFKAPIIIIIIQFLLLVLFGGINVYLLIALPIYLIANPLIRKNFHYSLEPEFFIVHQGVISKKQRNFPYGVIQHVNVKQDFFDRLAGLASLTVENAGVSGGEDTRSFRLTSGYNQHGDSVGASRNKVNIPGLKKADAEMLKKAILEKMEAYQQVELSSGL